MLNKSFLFFFTILLSIYIFIELFFSFIFTSIHMYIKIFFSNSSKKYNTLFKNNLIFILNINLLLFLLTYKSDSFNNYIYIICIILSLSMFSLKKLYNNNLFIKINFLILLLNFNIINNLLSFFLILEASSVLFFFYFIDNNNNLIQLKNNFIYYLLNNFFTSIFYFIGLIGIIEQFGTLNLNELTLFIHDYKEINFKIYCLLISFIVKLNLPGFHFLKIELYKYISFENVILFSILTIYINYFFIMFISNTNLFFFLSVNFKINIIIICISLIIILSKLYINNFNEFIAYSGFLTNIIILLNLF